MTLISVVIILSISLSAVLIAYRIGFSMAMKIKDIKTEIDDKQESGIKQLIAMLDDFVNDKIVNKSHSKNYGEKKEIETKYGVKKDARTFF